MAQQYNVLAVDDSDDDLLLLRLAMRETPRLRIDATLHNGAEAIDFLAGEGAYADRQQYPLPDLVLLDLKMHGASGFDVLQWLGQHLPNRFFEVIVLSSSMDLGDIRRAMELGADFFQIKPTDLQAFVQLARWLEVYMALLRKR